MRHNVNIIKIMLNNQSVALIMIPWLAECSILWRISDQYNQRGELEMKSTKTRTSRGIIMRR
jgi:hypothetical protein